MELLGRSRWPACLAAATLVACALHAGADPGHASAAAYNSYLACGIKPSDRCPASSNKGAFFRSFDRDVRYTVCVDFPRGKTLCARQQPAERGTLYVNRITSNLNGLHVARWFVAGKQVGLDRFFVGRPERPEPTAKQCPPIRPSIPGAADLRAVDIEATGIGCGVARSLPRRYLSVVTMGPIDEASFGRWRCRSEDLRTKPVYCGARFDSVTWRFRR